MQTIALIARKGGVGKTTSTVSLAGCLAARGIKTLAIDFDPQASLTAALGVPGPLHGGAAALFAGTDPAGLIVPTRFPGLSLLPGSPDLDRFNTPTPDGAAVFVLRDWLNGVSGFERVFIDCPPNLYCLSLAAMTAADYVLTPTFADADGIDAIRFVNAQVAGVQAGPNPALEQLGIVLGAYQKRNAVNIAYADLLRRHFQGLLLDEVIPHAAAFKEARKLKAPVAFCKPKIEASKAVGRVVDEIEARMIRFTTHKEVA